MKLLKNVGLAGVFILLVSVTPAFAIDEKNRNMFLIYAMYFTPFVLVVYNKRNAYIESVLVLLGFLMLVIPLSCHPETFRLSTVLYGWMFFLFFMSYARVLKETSYTKEAYTDLLRGLIYAYFVTLVIQQICVLAGLPIFNKAAYNPIEPWKLNALSPEPSHTARIMSLLLFLYVKMKLMSYKDITMKQAFKLIDKKVFYCYLYCILTMGSGTGFLFLFLLLLQFIPKKSVALYSILSVTAIVVSYYALKDIPSFKRFFTFFTMFINYNEDVLIQEDLSAAIRIVPTIHGFQAIDFFSFDSLVGHGIDADEGLTPLPSVDCGAGSFSLWYNYGLIVSIIFWVFSFNICSIRGERLVSIIIWLLLVFFYGGINNPIIWLTIILMYTYNYLEKRGRAQWESV